MHLLIGSLICSSLSLTDLRSGTLFLSHNLSVTGNLFSPCVEKIQALISFQLEAEKDADFSQQGNCSFFLRNVLSEGVTDFKPALTQWLLSLMVDMSRGHCMF